MFSTNLRKFNVSNQVLLLTIVILGLVSRPAVYGQEPESPPLTEAAIDRIEGDEEETQGIFAEIQKDIASRNPADFNAAYLVSETGLANAEYLRESGVLETFGVRPTTDWQDFLGQHETDPVQIILFEKSALTFADIDWMRQAYKSKIIILGFDLSYDEMVKLTGDHCAGADNNVDFEHQVQVFYYSHRVSAGDEQIDAAPELAAEIDAASAELCSLYGHDDEIQALFDETIDIAHGFYFLPLLDETWGENLATIAMTITHKYGMPNPTPPNP